MKLKKRDPSSHKGDNGTVLVVGGSREYTGAVYLAAKAVAAMRTGADLVVVACPERVAWSINSLSPDLITSKLKGLYINSSHSKQISRLVSKADVLLVGPGIGLRKPTQNYTKKLLENTRKPKVIDADALKVANLRKISNAILTPHRQEFELLLKNSRVTRANYRKHLGSNVILLKGSPDQIISKTRTRTNQTGNAGMTVGGTGDVLAGLCAGFAAQGNSLFDSAVAAARVNGRIGDRLRNRLGYGFIASDFLKEIAKQVKGLTKTS